MIIQDKSFVAHPRVSVIVCCYNQADTIGQTIESIMAQEFPEPYELIIGDDASADRTREICLSYQQQYPDRIKLLFHEQNSGVTNNFKALVREVRGEVVCMSGGDDYWIHPRKLALQYAFLQDQADCGVVHTSYNVLDTTTGKITLSPVPKDWSPADGSQLLNRGNFIGALTIMIRRKLLVDALEDGLFDRFMMEDYPLWMFATANSKLGFINEVTAVWRKNQESISNSQNLVRSLRFELEITSIRHYFAERLNRSREMRPTLVNSYKYILRKSFIERECELASLSFRKLQTLGGGSWKDILYGHPLLQPVGHLLRRLRRTK